jgi:hypothetical protein
MNTPQERGEPERGEGLGGRVRRFVDSELSRVLDKENRPTDTPAHDYDTPAHDYDTPVRDPDTPAHDYDTPVTVRRVEETGLEQVPRRPADATAERVGLLNDPAGLREQWQQVQGTFVDDPRRAVEEASVLVNRTLQEIHENVTRGEVKDPTSTEELRVSFQRYREFFQRLLSA